jgi:alpha-N-arabinofuranosidase
VKKKSNKMRKLIYSTLALLSLLSLGVQAQNSIVLQVDSAKQVISKDIYGQFAEHLGNCIYGGIYVGKDSKIANNNGYRIDVLNALKEMKIPLLRWPGGCFADTYHWKDGIGPKAQRPSMVNIHWGGVTEDNSFGTHEFLDFCQLLGADAYVNINVGSGTVQEASEWVEYITSSNESPMTNLRKANGHEDPWNVKYFGIGNENWGCGGNMTPDYYADLYRRFASYTGGAHYKIAGGPNVDDYNWTEVLMRKTEHYKHLIQGLSLHYYTLPNGWEPKVSATKFDEKMWHKTLKSTLYMEELIQKHTAIMDKYDPKHSVGLIVDEWGTWFQVEPGTNPGFLYQQNTLRDALVAGINLNIFNQHAARIQMANIAQMVNVLQAVILTKDDKMVLTPTYYIFKMYAPHQNAKLIPSTLITENYTVDGDAIPELSASASVKDDIVSVTLCNLNPNKAVDFLIDLKGFKAKNATAQVVTAPNMTDFNDFDKAQTVTLAELKIGKIKDNKLSLKLPSKSVVLVQFSK